MGYSAGTRLIARALAAALWLVSSRPGFAEAADSPKEQAASQAAKLAPVQPSRPPKIPASAFTGGQSISRPRLSPDGKRMAFTILQNGQKLLVVSDPVNKQGQWRLNVSGKTELNWFRFAGSDRLLFSVSGTSKLDGEDVRFYRLYVVDIPSRSMSYVGRKEEGILGDDVLYTDPDGQYVLLALQTDIYSYPSIWRFPLDGTATKNGKQVQAPIDGVWDWYADDVGVVRMGVEYGEGYRKIRYRTKPEDPLKVIATLTKKDNENTFYDTIRIITGSDEGYMIQTGLLGETRLVKFNYATRQVGEVIYQKAGQNLTDFSFGRDNKPAAVYFTDETDRIVWLDPKMNKIQGALNKALDEPDVSITSRSKDDTRMLIWAGGDNDAGAYYYFDNTAHKLDLLAVQRPALAGVALPRPKPIDYKARDGVTIHAYLTLPLGREAKGLPLIILPHGGPYGVRDMLDYSDEVQFLANRGYAVLQPNFRGSDGYGEGFAGLGEGQIGRAMQDDLDDGMDDLVKQGIVDPKRVCIEGASYGGYAAAWAVIRNPERYRCAASFAGVMNWKRQLSYDRNFFSNSAAKKKWRNRVAGGEDGKFNLDLVSPAVQAGRLARPLLLAHGDKDTNVPFSQFKLMSEAAAKTSPPIETLVFEGEGHGFDKPEDEEKWYSTLEAFLAKYNPAD